MPQLEYYHHRPHPDFKIISRRLWYSALLVFATLFVLGSHFSNNDGSRAITIALLISPFIGLLLAFFYFLYKLYHIDCPSCHALTKTIKNEKMSKYEAVCDRCKIVWDTGIEFSD
jgi:phosphate/sulfate permease